MKAILLLLYSSVLFAQGEFKTFISYVNTIQDSLQKTAAVDSFMNLASSEGIPFIKDSTANFIYRGLSSQMQIAGDFTSWSPSVRMLKLQGTDFFYYSQYFETNARLDYKLVTDGTWILDPLNPNYVAGGFGPNSELAMPGYIQPQEIKYNLEIPHGEVLNIIIKSSETGIAYNISVYLPTGYNSFSAEPYPAVYFQDGSEYLNLGFAANVLDNLIDAKRIWPAVAVFVTPENRGVEYAGAKRNDYRQFFVNELVPYIDSTYNTSTNPSDRIVIGDSWGGNISALISFNHPETFGNCGLHSAAVQSNDNEAYDLILNGPRKEIKFAAVWGTYESLCKNMRSFRDGLLEQGYSLRWSELPEGHSWGLWRANIDFILEYFIPGENKN
jgi:enterochelin esterase-like enzyme